MSLESNPNQAFLGNNTEDDDFAALDSMAFTGTQSQFGNRNIGVTPSGGSFGGSSNDSHGRVGDGREGGFTGVSESLFDRIRARTAEQQKQSLSSQSSQVSQSPSFTQEAAQSSQQHSAFMSQQQPSSQPTMELENNFDRAFDAAVTDASTGTPANNQNNNVDNNETTYSFSANAGEDFSQADAPHVPQYGPSRDDPYYAATSNQQQQHPTSIQDKASMALAQTGNTVKSLLGAGLNGAKTIGAMAQDKMGGGKGGGRGERSYNNNFLMREDSLEEGNIMNTATMSQPPPPVSAAVASGSEAGASGQAYSMLSYGKTFCQDLFGFVMDLPPWGKGIVAVVLIWALYVFFDTI